jgi:hypothetical protein
LKVAAQLGSRERVGNLLLHEELAESTSAEATQVQVSFATSSLAHSKKRERLTNNSDHLNVKTFLKPSSCEFCPADWHPYLHNQLQFAELLIALHLSGGGK